MGLFDFLRKKEEKEMEKAKSFLLSMPLFSNGATYDLQKVIAHLKQEWKAEISDKTGDNQSATFLLDGELVALATILMEVPQGDIEGAAQHAYNWPKALQDLKNHNSHVIATVASSDALKRFKTLTKVLDAILSTSENAIGVYMGSQSLLIPKQEYLEGAQGLKADELPLNLWYYTGLRSGEQGNSAYTYGLTSFGKQEIEIINSKLSLEELYGFLANVCYYLLENDITFRTGETFGFSEDHKITITSSAGVYVPWESLKLAV